MIVIPMAGESRRFRDAGYEPPKYRLMAHGRSLFAHALSSFAAYFAREPFRFVFRDVSGTAAFVEEECRRLGIAHADFVALQGPTAGQAETVLLALDGIGNDEPVTVFNIDTSRPNFRFPAWWDERGCDGYLEVFQGSGSNWSFVRPDPARPGFAAETAEKRPISDLCCTGLYHFRSAALFRRAYAAPVLPSSEAEERERYVAPLYNGLIASGRGIRFEVIPREAVTFFGTPQEYADFCGTGTGRGQPVAADGLVCSGAA
jgi:hypothetical protein